MYAEFREWIIPAIAIGTLLWQAYTALRKNVVRPEDLAKFATNDDLMGVNKVLQDQIDQGERETTRAHHRVDLQAQKMETLPNYSDINRLREAISGLTNGIGKLTSDVEGLGGTVDRMGNAVDRVELYLLELKLPKATP